MYSLPITTYSDYWRATKVWSSYLGGLAVLVAGTRFSALTPEMKDMGQLFVRQPVNSLQAATPTVGQQQSNIEANNLNITSTSVISDRVTTKTELKDTEIPFETQYIESEKVLPGMRRVQEEGEKGVAREVVKIFEANGQPTDQQVYAFELKAPKKKVVIQNSKPAVGEHFELANVNVTRTISVEATAYTYTGNRTATGLEPREGLIAVDPKVIPLGTKVYVEGYGYAIAADTGGDIRGNRIDVFFANLRRCIDWGRKPVRVHVLASK